MSNIALLKDEKHPINEYRPPSAPFAYKLIKWKPIYDQIVAGHIIGRSNKELAAQFDFTPVHISNILRTDNAQKLIYEASNRIRAGAITVSENILSDQEEIKRLALSRVKDFLSNDVIATNQPFAFIDRVKHFVSSPSAPSPSVQVNVQNNTQVNNTSIRDESLARIATALEISGKDE